MKKFAARLVIGFAAAGMAFAPVAANANTRAGDSARFYAQPSAVGVGQGRTIAGSQVEGVDDGSYWLLALLGLSGIVAALVLVGQGSSNGAN